MKKAYLKPELEISVFATEDIITTSAVDTIDTDNAAPLGDADFDVSYKDLFGE